MRPNEAKTLLKNLGYAFSPNYGTCVLPGTLMHKSKPGQDQFDKIIDLFNDIARFGLVTADKKHSDDELSVSDEERLNLEVFVASVATFDVCKRIKCNAPIRKKSRVAKQESAATTAPHMAKSALNTAQQDAGETNDAVTKSDAVATLVVDEGDQDSPQQSPPKKPRTHSITKFFTHTAKKVVDGVAATFSPMRYSDSESLGTSPTTDQQLRAAKSRAPSLNLSPSCMITRGDDEIEAWFASSPEREVPTAPESAPQESSSHSEHYPQAESPSMPWSHLWAQMRRAGWKYIVGNELVAWYFIHPSAAEMKKADILRECTDGIHYFSTEEAVHRYAMRHLGWAGDGAIESPISLDISMTSTSRVKKRNLVNAALKSDGASSPPKRSRASSEDCDEKVIPTPKQASPTRKSRSSPRSKKNEAEKSPQSKSNVPKPSEGDSVNSQSSGEKDLKAPPDEQPTVRDKLECCQMVLHPSFKNHQLSKSSIKSVVSSNEDDIKDFMTKSIQTGTTKDGTTLPSPGFMYICGGSGTGKTTAVISCADEMKKWAKRNGYKKTCFCHINMERSQTLFSEGGIMRAMLMKIATAIEIDVQAQLSTFEKQFKKKTVVLVLDQIDMLFKKHGGIGETWFRTLIEWAEDRKMRFSMIGISNCVDDANATRVREIGNSPRELVFSAYKEEDILAILEQRLGKNAVDHKALQLISRRVAASSGDARRALDITSNAVSKCSDLLSNEQLGNVVKFDDECMPLVKLPHMMRAIREAMPMRHADIISGLPQAAKVVLCICVSLSHVWGPTAEISISILKKYCVQATHHALMDELGLGHIKVLVDTLVDSGLLVTGNNAQFNPHDANSKLKIGVQMSDVEIALEQSLLSGGGFYQSLVDYIKRECPHAPDFTS
mmetsp:Transcript_11814/g.25906  ORF Transcript_11814/g.25906 Transcript_11814/m.25906 type:complete len:893 (-) Transcript_11814:67-2745(-)